MVDRGGGPNSLETRWILSHLGLNLAMNDMALPVILTGPSK